MIKYLAILSLLFIGLKLANFIAWSWWWVLAPIWAIPVLLVMFFGLYIWAQWDDA